MPCSQERQTHHSCHTIAAALSFLQSISIKAKCRLDTRAEVLRDLDAEWEVADDVIVTEAQPRSLLHHPRPTTRQLVLLTGLDTALGSLSGLLHTGLGHWSHSLDEAEGTNELTSHLDLPQLFSCLSRRRWHSGILPRYLELPWGAYRLNSRPGGGQTRFDKLVRAQPFPPPRPTYDGPAMPSLAQSWTQQVAQRGLRCRSLAQPLSERSQPVMFFANKYGCVTSNHRSRCSSTEIRYVSLHQSILLCMPVSNYRPIAATPTSGSFA